MHRAHEEASSICIKGACYGVERDGEEMMEEEEEEVPDAELVRLGQEVPGMLGAWDTICAVGR